MEDELDTFTVRLHIDDRHPSNIAALASKGLFVRLSPSLQGSEQLSSDRFLDVEEHLVPWINHPLRDRNSACIFIHHLSQEASSNQTNAGGK